MPTAPARFDAATLLYLWLSGVFVTCLLVADITGGKFFHLDLFTVHLPWVGEYPFVTHSVGMMSFPVTFLLTDLVNEYYGKRGARRMTFLGLGCALLAFLLILAARKIPVDTRDSPLSQDSFDTVFGMSNRLYVASLTAYLIGQLCDIWLFGAFKRWTGGRMVWLRATGSTVVSQAVDSFLITSILFYGLERADGSVATWGDIIRIAVTGYILKFVIAIALTPLVYLGRWLIHTRLGMTPMPAEPRI
ncbi:MAG: queuosine precursor transporter [Phycisphaerales bacterium]|nr:queuosine precursor transporter [Phycisphaerales bacterium]